MYKKIIIFSFLLSFLFPAILTAQELIQDTTQIYKAKVLSVASTTSAILPGTDVPHTVQKIEIEILDKDKKGERLTIDNDYVLLSKGDTFYLSHTIRHDSGRGYYTVSDPIRTPWLLFFTILFVVLVCVFGGIQGVRGLASLAGSLVLILYVLIPSILAGTSPLLVSIGVSTLIIVLGSYITHGFNKTTTSAVIGMVATVLFTGALAFFAVHITHLTGFSSEEAIYLNYDTRGTLDFAGLLLGGIMIGLLGVLYDVAIGQAISVEELHRIGPHLSRRFIYLRAIRIGREHIGALVNTLAIAYVGTALPLLLLFSSSEMPFQFIVNREEFATEIIRTLIGSIGLVLAVPITTLLAILILMPKKIQYVDKKTLEEERGAIIHHHHHR